MHQVKVDIVHSQSLKAHIKVLLDAGVKCTPELRSNEDIASIDICRCQSFFQPFAHFLFVSVDEGAVYVAVAYRDRMSDSFLGLAGS